MSASATIVTQIARDALLVSNAAVKSASDGSNYVEVLTDGATTPTQVTVTTGLSSSTQTQILSGLSEGDKVVTSTSDSSDDTSSSGQGGFMMPGTAGRAGAGMGGPPQ